MRPTKKKHFVVALLKIRRENESVHEYDQNINQVSLI